MAIDFGAFAKGFLDRSQQIMDENSEEAKEFEKRQRELADRNMGVIGKRRSTATAVISAAKGLSNLGVPKSVIRLAISTPGGLAELKKKIDTARAEMGAEWKADLIESYVDLPDEFQDNELLQQDGVSLKDFVYNTYGLSTPSLGPTSDELDAEPSGKFSMFDDFFNKNAMEKARTELGNEMIYGDMSVSEINKLAKQDEYSSQIEGAYVDYKNPNYITPSISKTFLQNVRNAKNDWQTTNRVGLTKLDGDRETLEQAIRQSKDKSDPALQARINAYNARREALSDSLAETLEPEFASMKDRYGEDQFNEKFGSRMENFLRYDTPLDVSSASVAEGPIVTGDTPISIFEDATNLDEVNKTLNTPTLEMLSGSTSNNYVLKSVGGDFNGFTTEVRTDPQTGFLKVVTRNASNQIIPTLSFEDVENNRLATDFLENKAPELDFRVKLKDVASQFEEFKKVKTPVVIKSEVKDVSTEALNAAQTFFKGLNLTSSIDKSELNKDTRKYYNNLTGKLDKEKIKKEVRLWAINNYNQGRPRAERIDVSTFLGVGKSSLDDLTDNIFNLLTKTESPDVKVNLSGQIINDTDGVVVDTSIPEIPSIDLRSQVQDKILRDADVNPTFTEAPKVGLMSKPEVDFVAPDNPKTPAPPRSAFMEQYGDDIMELLLGRKNITLKNVEAGRIAQINNALDLWKRKNKGVKISAEVKKEIIAEYIRNKGK